MKEKNWQKTAIYADLEQNLNYIKKITGHSTDILVNEFVTGGIKCAFLCCDGMLSSRAAADMVLAPITDLPKQANAQGLFDYIQAHMLLSADRSNPDNYGDLMRLIHSGFAVFVAEGANTALAFGVQGFSTRGVQEPSGEGNILGRHSGIINYTVGQRKGLGAFGKPMFVNSICTENNTVIIGENGTQYCKGLIADNMNYIAFDAPDKPFRAEVKIRFRAKEQPAIITPLENGKAEIIFDEPQRSITPGQGAVIYDGDTVIGGGRIIKQID